MTAHVDSRTRIIEAASTLFVENGLQSSMAAIADAAQVAMGSLYHHFPSKEGLILEVCRQIAASMETRVVSMVDPTLPFDERVTQYVWAYIDLLWSDARLAALYDYLTNSPAIGPDEMAGIFDRVTRHSIEVFSNPCADRTDLSPQLTGSFIRGAIRNTLKRHRDTGEQLTDAARQRLVVMCRNALAA